jgi:LPPG:FO 2-phospho-L-lactate transferase
MSGKIITLSGGVGGAKLVLGLSHVVNGDDLVVACNTGDDFDHLSLRICPDIDSVLYALSGLSDQIRGWGRKDETWTFMSAIKDLQGPDWFNLGDRDLATHVLRTDLLRQGKSLGEVTANLAQRLGISATILPMSDDTVATIVQTKIGDLAFQHYFVREQCGPKVTGFTFDNIDRAQPQPRLLEALRTGPKAIVIAPSNPYVSVDPILGLPGLRKAMMNAEAPILAVSPIVGGQAIKGPAAKMMTELGKDVSVLGIAAHYQGLIDGLIIDKVDAELAPQIKAMGIEPHVTQTVMKDLEGRIELAQTTLDFAAGIAR